jgi:mannosyl-oligosaccharide alpha-1,2-mannosidase
MQAFTGYYKPTPAGDAPLASDFTQTLKANKFGRLDTDDLPSRVGPKLEADKKRRAAIKEAFEWSWDAYEKHAWGDDELQPISQTGTNLTAVGAVGYTIIDSIGSLLVMDMIPQYQHARDWVRDSLDFDKDANFNTFEVSSSSFLGPSSYFSLGAPDK